MSSSRTDEESGTHVVQVTMPALGPDTLEVVVVGWQKRPGDPVERDETICIVSAAGTRAAIASPASGRLVRLLTGVGARVGAGAALAEVEVEGVAWEEAKGEEGPMDLSTFHSPAVKRLAAEHELDLADIPGSGLGGRIRRDDVLAYLEARER
ncbi:MAG TPA: E3 binding domain-containing protein [Solirubrobacterales bacterium]|nr:E3 binding domain-containing protein [Solirubrobacterales bacterium]